jgi:hypothetical protein
MITVSPRESNLVRTSDNSRSAAEQNAKRVKKWRVGPLGAARHP